MKKQTRKAKTGAPFPMPFSIVVSFSLPTTSLCRGEYWTVICDIKYDELEFLLHL